MSERRENRPVDGPAAVIVLTTMPAGGDAAVTLARTLVERRLAACVNVLPAMQSIYRWRGAVSADDERQLVIKTTANSVAALTEALRGLHPYEVPELLVLPLAGGGDAYLRWVGESVAPATEAPPGREG